ncbi:hypothetical protein ACFE04_008268 [Oxalis oulophora]
MNQEENSNHQAVAAAASNNIVDDDFSNEFPPGYRFKPTDEELIVEYLGKKDRNEVLPPNKIIDVHLYNYNPETLAENYRSYQENQWYFFTPRDRKYPNGARPRRAAGDGFWKATGSDKPIIHNDINVGAKKTLVYYRGKPPRGTKTNWIMHEFRLPENQLKRVRNGAEDMRLDDWVLCRIYQKFGKPKKEANEPEAEEDAEDDVPNLSLAEIQENGEDVENLAMVPAGNINQNVIYEYSQMGNNHNCESVQVAAAQSSQMHPNMISSDSQQSYPIVAQVQGPDMKWSIPMETQDPRQEMWSSNPMVAQGQCFESNQPVSMSAQGQSSQSQWYVPTGGAQGQCSGSTTEVWGPEFQQAHHFNNVQHYQDNTNYPNTAAYPKQEAGMNYGTDQYQNYLQYPPATHNINQADNSIVLIDDVEWQKYLNFESVNKSDF